MVPGPPDRPHALAQLLFLCDGRFPSGGHAHSGGLEAAVAAGDVHDVASLELFLAGRLATAGLTSAALAATACRLVDERASDGAWAALDAEARVRTASPAIRAAGVRQGRQLLRAVRATWPASGLDALDALAPAGPQLPLVEGAAAAAAGLTPRDAALLSAYAAVQGPATAAVKLLGLDPLAVGRAIATLGPAVDAVAAEAAAPRAWDFVESPRDVDFMAPRRAGDFEEPPRADDFSDLPCPTAPLLDIGAEHHAGWEVRLFAS